MLLPAGALLYGAALLTLPAVPKALLFVPMIGAGIGAAMTFAPSLASMAALARGHHGAAMALLNAAGCLGMMLGPAASGLTITIVRRTGADPATAYAAAIMVAGAATLSWGVAVLLHTRTRMQRRSTHDLSVTL